MLLPSIGFDNRREWHMIVRYDDTHRFCHRYQSKEQATCIALSWLLSESAKKPGYSWLHDLIGTKVIDLYKEVKDKLEVEQYATNQNDQVKA